MLKQLRAVNYVHFEKEIVVTFENGSFFFIGENGSGKSCTLEGLRRCLSTSKNFLVSTSHKTDSDSVVLCKFSKIEDSQITIYSGYVRVSDSLHENNVDVKFVCEIRNEKVNKLFIDLTKANSEGLVINEELGQDGETLKEKLHDLFHEPEVKLSILIACVRENIENAKQFQAFKKGSFQTIGYKSTKCEEYLASNVDKYVVITDPMRSIGCVEWTNSERLAPMQHMEKGQELLEDMQKRCEILHWYFKSKFESQDSEFKRRDTRKLVRSYFHTITDTISLNFYYENGKIVVRDNQTNISLEKVPEGIFEAKICAILLAAEQFKTVCLDEPGRGMHPQMAERMRDLILRKIKDKTVIVTSHSPSFLGSWNIPQTYFFQVDYGKKDRGDLNFKIIPGKDIVSDTEKKTPRLITSQHFPSLFFARRLFIVEGEGEYLFVSAIKAILLGDDQLLGQVSELTKSKAKLEDVQRFLSSLHILPLNGEPNKVRIETICLKLNKERYVMLDFDAILQDKKDPTDTQKFLADFKLNKDEFVEKGMGYLEENGIFVFKRAKLDDTKMGTIEDAFISFTRTMDDGKARGDETESLEGFFDQHNLKLKWNKQSKNKEKNKLFNDQNLTDENINKVVEKILKICGTNAKAIDTELFRMVSFLVTRTENGEEKSTLVYSRKTSKR